MIEKKYILFGLLGGTLIGVVAYIFLKSDKESKRSPKNILFVGDSITAHPVYCYPAHIRKSRPDLNIDVLAKGGMTTKWMLQNLPIKLAANNYDRVYIYGGVNDAFSSNIKIPDVVSNVQKMIDMIRQDGSEAYVMLGYEPVPFMDYRKMPIYPENKYMYRKEDYIPLIERYKQLQAAYAKQLKNATVLPKMDLGTMTSDGTHPTLDGYKKIAKIVEETI